MIIGLIDLGDVVFRQRGQVGLSWEEPTQPAVDVFHAALLPGRTGVTEEGLSTQVVELVMACELSTVVEGDRPAPGLGEGSQEVSNGISHALGLFSEQGVSKEQAGVAFLEGEERLPPVAKGHEVGLPVTGSGAVVSVFGTLGQGLA